MGRAIGNLKQDALLPAISLILLGFVVPPRPTLFPNEPSLHLRALDVLHRHVRSIRNLEEAMDASNARVLGEEDSRWAGLSRSSGASVSGTPHPPDCVPLSAIRYTSFPTQSPPTTLAMETLESSACPNTRFRKPSIALVDMYCKEPIPKVGYLYASDEQTTAGSCQSGTTRVGPHVSERNNTSNTWAVIFDGTRTSTATASTVEPISLSLSTHFRSGATYLAWSDQESASARTMLARGTGASWVTPVLFEPARRHIHIQASGLASSPAGTFRVAWAGSGFSDEFFSSTVYHQDGVWTAATPVWSSTPTQITGGGAAGRPQAHYWGRCVSGQYSSIRFVSEIEGCCGTAFLSTDFSMAPPCPTASLQVVTVCRNHAVSIATRPPPRGVPTPVPVTLVDTSPLGVITRISPDGATIQAPQGTVTATWGGGKVVSSWDTGFSVEAHPDNVRFASSTVLFERRLTEYAPEALVETLQPREGAQDR